MVMLVYLYGFRRVNLGYVLAEFRLGVCRTESGILGSMLWG